MDELVERVRQALAAEYTGAGDGRIRDVPDRRAIRWYTTIGLVDRPLGMRGRTALYGPRHLQQLVAIKRRQAAGRSLSQIQGELNWLSDEALAELSDVPEGLLEADGPTPDDAANDRHMRFWARQPAPATAAMVPADEAVPAASGESASPPLASARAASGELTAAPPMPGAAASEQLQPDRITSGHANSGHAGSGPARSGTTSSGHASSGHASSGPARSGNTSSGNARARQAAPDQATSGQHQGAPARSSQQRLPRPVHGVALHGGAILLVPHPLSDRDRDDIAAAAAPLLDLLAARGLLDGSSA